MTRIMSNFGVRQILPSISGVDVYLVSALRYLFDIYKLLSQDFYSSIHCLYLILVEHNMNFLCDIDDEVCITYVCKGWFDERRYR